MWATDLKHRPESPYPSLHFRAVLFWIALVAIITAVLWAFRDTLDKAHMALAFLLVVLGGSARLGRTAGLALAVVCFFSFNFFLLSPHYTLAVADPLDWLVLLAFLITSAVAAQLLYRAQREAVNARQRAEEIDRLSTLGAETLNAGRAEEAVGAIANVIQRTLRITSCEVHVRDQEAGVFHCVALAPAGCAPVEPRPDSLLPRVLDKGVLAFVRSNGTTEFVTLDARELSEALCAYGDACILLIPLRVRGRGVGILRLANRETIRLDAAQARFAEVLAYYAALGVERVRLGAAAERADALREADRLKDALLASVSHDLRTPLTTIQALAHELGAAGDDRALTIKKEADRLNRLVGNLLDLSRLNGGALPLFPELTPAEDLVGAALSSVSGAHIGREIHVTIDEQGSIIVGRFDFSHSLRALVNLLENALKYSPTNSPIELRVRRQEERIAFAVLDRGPGIPVMETTRIFEPFYRTAGAEPDVGGTGLGLAIARRLAEAQGGTVHYEPRPAGGSVFTLLLPAADPQEGGPISL